MRVNVGEASTRPERFPKARDQMWWEIGRQVVMEQAVDLAGLDDRTVVELIAPTWKPDSSARVQVENGGRAT